ncbi:MAG: DUF4349 domain-containing protein [Myxococcota bacterium]
MNRFSLMVCFLFTVVVAAVGCSRSKDAAPASMSESHAASVDHEEDMGALAASAGERKEPVVAPRKLIQTAELAVEVDDYRATRRRLDTLLASFGGFVADAQIDHHEGEVSRARLVLRVPSDRLATFLHEASGEGEVLREQLNAEDVTDAYVDTAARRKNARHLEARLQELVASQTSGVKDLLEVERELARVRGEIERYDAQIRSWDERVAMSTVTLELTTRRVYVAAAAPTFTEDARSQLASSWRALAGFGRGTALVAIAFLPWALPLAAFAWLMRAGVRRVRRARGAAA